VERCASHGLEAERIADRCAVGARGGDVMCARSDPEAACVLAGPSATGDAAAAR
jgi:hypothetical protein